MLIKMHLQKLEEFGDFNKKENIIKKIHDFEATQKQNIELKKKLSELSKEDLDSAIIEALEANEKMRFEIEILKKKIESQNKIKTKSESDNKMKLYLDAFA